MSFIFLFLLFASVSRRRHRSQVAPAVVKWVAILVVHILAVAFTHEAILFQTAAGFVTGGTTANLFLGSLVGSVFFFVVTHCSKPPVSSTSRGTLHP